VTGWRVERSEDGEAVLTFGGLPVGQGFGLVACFGGEAPDAYTALADALERDRKVAEIVAAIDNEPPSGTAGVTSNARLFLAVAALYPEAGK
jgi:hypothetical protein